MSLSHQYQVVPWMSFLFPWYRIRRFLNVHLQAVLAGCDDVLSSGVSDGSSDFSHFVEFLYRNKQYIDHVDSCDVHDFGLLFFVVRPIPR